MFPSPITIGSKTFERLRDGQFIDIASTVDTPSLLLIANRNLIGTNGAPISNGQPGQITITRLIHTNSAVPGGPDAVLKVWRSYQWVQGEYDKAAITAADGEITTFVTATGVMDRLLRAST